MKTSILVALLVGGCFFILLIFFLAIGSLAYYGVLSPDRFLAEKCVLTGGVFCLDHAADDGGLMILLLNANGYDIKNIQVQVDGNICGGNAVGPSALQDGAQAQYKVLECAGRPGKLKADITVAARNAVTDQEQVWTGEVVAALG